MAKDLSMTILLDVYGMLLTDRQRETMELYFEHDLSLGEISEETGITRQGVMNCIKKSSGHLRELEKTLGLVRRFKALERDIAELEGYILMAEVSNEAVMADIEDKLVEIKNRL